MAPVPKTRHEHASQGPASMSCAAEQDPCPRAVTRALYGPASIDYCGRGSHEHLRLVARRCPTCRIEGRCVWGGGRFSRVSCGPLKAMFTDSSACSVGTYICMSVFLQFCSSISTAALFDSGSVEHFKQSWNAILAWVGAGGCGRCDFHTFLYARVTHW